MTILQMHLVPSDVESSRKQVEIEKCGKGQIVWIPVCFHPDERSLRALLRRLRVLAASRNVVFPANGSVRPPIVWPALGNLCGHFRYSTMILSEVALDVLDQYRVNLIILHWLSYDVTTLLSHAARRHVPYAVIHHFDNNRLSSPELSRLLRHTVAVGGVSNINVPVALRSSYVNLSDAVDAAFFCPDRANAVHRREDYLVLLPSRVIEGKGHCDLLEAAANLLRKGINLSVAFAGVIESELLAVELRKQILLLGLTDRVFFLGQLTQEGLRDWYASSDVVVLPSSSEGLGRVLLEAQAMEKPVIAYDSGGIPEAILPDETGILVKSGDRDALTEGLHRILNDSAGRLAMGKTGREFVLNYFSVNALIGRHERFYSNALDSQCVGKPAFE